ncbi:hypothetical protein ACIQMR_33520 [Streptomyces sp. NPDC091376]|uniref:hypothetical protein n=1 Tax=Streptomyces sp. NPDC091376 TaxID=3365994 RepID=UPI003802201D
MRADDSRHIVTAAHSRHEYARAKAIQALREFDAAGTVVIFDIVARAAGVSRTWLCTRPGLRADRQPTIGASLLRRLRAAANGHNLRLTEGHRQL